MNSFPSLLVDELVLMRPERDRSYSFTLTAGEWLGIVGPSGIGKSSLLHTLVGLLPPLGGRVLVEGGNVLGLAPHKREMSIVFQHSMLLGHLTVGKSLLLALHDSRLGRGEKQQKIAEHLAMLSLAKEFLRRYPDELSGGELARCNLAGALLREKKILLLDEPFAALNESLRTELGDLLKKLQKERQLTILAVTHQREEAERLSTQLLSC